MKKLNFPVIQGELPEAKSLSMKDYLQFVQTNRSFLFNRVVYKDWKKRSVVKVPFKLK